MPSLLTRPARGCIATLPPPVGRIALRPSARPLDGSFGRSRRLFAAGLAACALLLAHRSEAATLLADQPLFAASDAPGNLALLLSVEFPTAVSVAHTDRSYASAREYLGFFDPAKCYEYRYTDGAGVNDYFYPVGAATSRRCNGKWSGNFLNWSSMQTIDPFRWVLTGGYRVVDTVSLTVVEKAWATGQGGAPNFPDSVVGNSELAGATPFPASAGPLYMRIQGLGNKMRFTLPDTSGGISFDGEYYNNRTLSGNAVLRRTDTAIDFPSIPTGPGFNTENVSIRWKGKVTAPTAGAYRFQAGADDGVRLWVDGVLVIDQWRDQGTTYYESPVLAPVAAGYQFDIKLEYYQGGGGAAVRLLWKRPTDGGYVALGAPVSSLYANAAAYNPAVARTGGAVYETFMRAKVCDPTASAGGVEANCIQYGENWKPEGLMQKYAAKIRYSAFGYLNDSNVQRDGGILRAKQKFVGPMQPVPGAVDAANPVREWDPATGIFARNPNGADATATNTLFGTTVQDSGVMNYLNKFGEITPGSYKTYDNVSELYYAAIRYFKNQGNVPEWTSMAGANAGTRAVWADGFPVITQWDDPILYSCQRNFVLGIGDVNTHADKNVAGNTTMTANEPTLPPLVAADGTVNAVAATNKLGILEGLGNNLGMTYPFNGCCTDNSALMAGLAYASHTKDLRPNDFQTPGQTRDPITLDTYWVDVQEFQQYKANNQFYLATKYGGFTVPRGYDFEANTTPLSLASWHTSADTVGGQPRPDNYFAGGRPDLVQAGLTAAFADIASKIKSYTTSFSTSLPQVATSGNSSFSSQFDASDWKGEVKASELNFDANGNPSTVEKWSFSVLLQAQLAGNGWSNNRRVVTWNTRTDEGVPFRAGNISSGQRSALDTPYASGDDSTLLLNYLRGDQTNEAGSTATGSTQAYRSRNALIGDIVGSKARPIGPPSFPFSDANNPGYSGFKNTWAARPTVVYVGANDGMLHAINGSLALPAGGVEMFAYVPAALFQGPNGTPSVDGLASLGNPSFVHHYLVNATPSVYDIDFGRTANGSGQARTAAPDWRSVLIGGLGKGGRSYYALDVTNPAGMVQGGESAVASKVLWEFTDPDLGYTYGEPVVVKTRKYGWVVIFVSGYNNSTGQGYFMVVNPRTGALLEKVSTGAGSPSNSAGLAYANAFIVDATDGTADAVYAGDLLGNVWRLDLTAAAGTAYAAPKKIAFLTDGEGGPAQPITSRPTIEVHPGTRKRFVMIGTGKLLSTADIASTQNQSFYAITDGNNARFNRDNVTPSDLPAGITFPIDRSRLVRNTSAVPNGVVFNPSTQMGWYEDLGNGANGIGWRVTSDASTLAGSVAFAATLPNGSVCNPSGSSNIYGRDYAVGASSVKSAISGSLSPAVYVTQSGTVTDLRYLSVRGKAVLISGNDLGNVTKIEINAMPNPTLRRLNWRELPVVE